MYDVPEKQSEGIEVCRVDQLYFYKTNAIFIVPTGGRIISTSVF